MRLAIAFVVLAGCTCRYRKALPEDGLVPDSDADSDSESESGTGTGTGTGTDSDSETDADTDTDTATATDSDTDTDTATATATDSDSDTETDSESTTDFDAGACNGKIGDPVPHELSYHCELEGGPDGGCAYVSWDNNPPASGVHCPFWEPDCGEHDDVVPRCNWVHNLEHGWVILLWNCPGGCDAELEPFRQMLDDAPVQGGFGSRILMTEDPELDSRFAVVAWDWVWEGDELDLEILHCFVTWHYGGGPEGGGMPDGGLSIDAGGPICP